MKDTRDWTPIRKENIYCSPACGYHCTYADYQKAVRESNFMIKKLGKQWETKVHENLGWFNGVELQIDKDNWISVDKNYKAKEYTAQLNHTHNIQHSKDPKKVVELVIKQFTKEVNENTKLLNNILKLI